MIAFPTVFLFPASADCGRPPRSETLTLAVTRGLFGECYCAWKDSNNINVNYINDNSCCAGKSKEICLHGQTDLPELDQSTAFYVKGRHVGMELGYSLGFFETRKLGHVKKKGHVMRRKEQGQQNGVDSPEKSQKGVKPRA